MTTLGKHRTRIIEVIAEILEIDHSLVHGAQRLREDLGMDSLASLELLSVISQELDIEIEMESTLAIRTVDDACVLVEQHFVEQRAATHARV